MIEVWISGRTRRAVVDDGQDVRLLRYGAPDDLEPCSPRQIDALRDAGAAEMRVLSAPPDPRALHAELARAVATARARSGIETLLDPDFSLAARHLAAEEIEPLLGDAAMARATAARLEVGPLPVEPDVRGARRLCDVNRLEHVAALVEAYGDKLAVLRAAWEAWDELVRRADLDVTAQENAREWFATSGGFAALSDEVRQPARHAFAQWLVSRAASAPAPMRTAARTLERLPRLVRERLARYDAPSALTPAAIVAEPGESYGESAVGQVASADRGPWVTHSNVKRQPMSQDQRAKCHVIIHHASASAAAAGAGLAQLPVPDASVLVPLQIGMIVALGRVFGVEITEAAAKRVALGMSGIMWSGRALVQVLVGWIPGIGNAVNASTAASLTEAMGWVVAERFSSGDIPLT